MSSLVRKSAALAIPKCYRLDPGAAGVLEECLDALLGDRDVFVVGAAVMAMLEVCPERWEMVHRRFRGLCGMLVDMEDWGQLATLRLLTAYSRACFPLTKRSGRKGGKVVPLAEGVEVGYILDPDLELFLEKCTLLLQSRNSAVRPPPNSL